MAVIFKSKKNVSERVIAYGKSVNRRKIVGSCYKENF